MAVANVRDPDTHDYITTHHYYKYELKAEKVKHEWWNRREWYGSDRTRCGTSFEHGTQARTPKLPTAAAEFCWQYIFPSARLSKDLGRTSHDGIMPTRRPCRESFLPR